MQARDCLFRPFTFWSCCLLCSSSHLQPPRFKVKPLPLRKFGLSPSSPLALPHIYPNTHYKSDSRLLLSCHFLPRRSLPCRSLSSISVLTFSLKAPTTPSRPRTPRRRPRFGTFARLSPSRCHWRPCGLSHLLPDLEEEALLWCVIVPQFLLFVILVCPSIHRFSFHLDVRYCPRVRARLPLTLSITLATPYSPYSPSILSTPRTPYPYLLTID